MFSRSHIIYVTYDIWSKAFEDGMVLVLAALEDI